jgi:hypothetical protein
MVAEAITGLSALKSAFDIAKGLKDIDNATRRNAAVIELQEKILTAQTAQSDLTERIRDLEAKVAGFETWEREKQRYELKPFGNGVAYFLKPEMSNGEAPHQLCANCYARGKKPFSQNIQLPRRAKRSAPTVRMTVTNAKPRYDSTSDSVAHIRDLRSGAFWIFAIASDGRPGRFGFIREAGLPAPACLGNPDCSG